MGQWWASGVAAPPRVVAVVYVSATSAEMRVMEAMASAANVGRTSRLLTRFHDASYGRGSLVVGAAEAEDAVASAVSMASVALEALDLRDHTDATHPRIGVVDHISLAPMADGPDAMRVAAESARQIARRMGDELGVPAFLYGAAHPKERRLVEARKLCNYFTAVPGDEKVAKHASPSGEVDADFGPRAVNPAQGVCCVGAVTLVCNYNVEIATTDRAVAKRICDAVRTKRGAQERGKEKEDVPSMRMAN
eukprot:scaffold1390_cov249-Pinguiococcus_pyrenoidosus.AAC.16